MNTSSLIKRAGISALGVYLYVLVLTFFMNNAQPLFAKQPPGWLIGSLMLTLFVVSACATGTMVLLKPITLYMDGQKRDALRLFGYTVIALTLIALVVGSMLVALYRS